MTTITRPAPDEYAEFHQGYLAAIADDTDALTVLERQQKSIEALRGLSARQASHRYGDGKWSVKEVIGHLADAERVLSYRTLRIARGDATPLPGFDENAFVAAAGADARNLDDLVAELSAVRAATLTLVRSLDEKALANRGMVRSWTLSTRALVFIIAGHFAHTVNILRERYGVAL